MIVIASRKYPNLWDRWVKKSIIPGVVLLKLWDMGFKFQYEPPKDGIRLKTFLELLWKRYQSLPAGKDKDNTLSLYIDTVKSELMPDYRDKIKSKTRRRLMQYHQALAIIQKAYS